MSQSLLTSPKNAVVAVVTIGMAAVGYWFGTQRLNNRAANPLSISETALQMGKVLARGMHRHEIPITNTSRQTVRIDRIQSSCWCTEIKPDQFQLAPGETVNLVMTLDLMAASRLDSPQAEQPLTITLIPHLASRVPSDWPRWQIQGVVQLPAVLSRNRVVFDGADRLVQGITSPTCTARVITHASVANLQLVSAAEASLIQAELERQTETEWEIRFRARDEIPVGLFDELFHLHVELVDDSGPAPQMPIHVSGVVAADVQTLPEAVTLGLRTVGSQVREQIQVFSVGEREFVLRDLSVHDAHFTVTCETADQQQSAHLLLLAGNVGSGRTSGHVTAEVHYSNGETAVLEVPLLLHGH